MSYKIIDAFAVHGDGGNEYNIGPIIGYCATQADAQVMSQGKGWWGGAGAINKAKLLVVGDEMFALERPDAVEFMSADGLRKASAEAARQRARAKLNAEDLAALGLK